MSFLGTVLLLLCSLVAQGDLEKRVTIDDESTGYSYTFRPQWKVADAAAKSAYTAKTKLAKRERLVFLLARETVDGTDTLAVVAAPMSEQEMKLRGATTKLPLKAWITNHPGFRRQPEVCPSESWSRFSSGDSACFVSLTAPPHWIHLHFMNTEGYRPLRAVLRLESNVHSQGELHEASYALAIGPLPAWRSTTAKKNTNCGMYDICGHPVSTPCNVLVREDLMNTRIIKSVVPVYPPQAQSEGLQGKVELLAYINKEGQVAELEVLSGDPVFIPAAIDAVRQREYAPYILNGVPIDAQARVSVKFTLPEMPVHFPEPVRRPDR